MRELELEIVALDKRGAGIGKSGKKRYRVDYAYPGDKVLATPMGRGRARLVKVLEASEARVTPRCEHFSRCGSCRWQGLSYEAQLRFKGEVIQKLFAQEAQVKPSPKIWYYRNRMDFTIASHAIGMRRYSSFAEVESAEGCLLLSKESDEILRLSQEFFQEKKLEAYDILAKKGFLRYLVVREGKFTGQRLINVVTTEGKFPVEEYAGTLGEFANSVVWAVNDSLADVSFGEIRAHTGEGYLEERLGGITYRIPAFSFFQTNPYQAECLLACVKSWLGGRERLLDLYCGVGTFSLALADLASEVVGIEEDAEAIEAAKLNAVLNDINNASFIAGKAEATLAKVGGRFDAVLVDPPRAGLHPKVIAALNKLSPEVIIYVSCNPYTQAEDIKKLEGYEVEELSPFDMFPHTPHVENIALLSRR
jgi:23S rRNA (uracil-5-)-methyltransferase RumA